MPSGDDAPSPYRRLGVPEGATRAQVRIAYLNLARTLHPDRLVDASDAERGLAERRMREVNEAYEALQRGTWIPATPSPPPAGTARPTPSAPTTDDDADEVDEAVAPWDDDDIELGAVTAFVLRRGPLIAALVVAAILFVVTAYAGGPSDPPEPTAPTTTCASTPPTAVANGATFTLPC